MNIGRGIGRGLGSSMIRQVGGDVAAAVAAITYLLRATFTAGNQTFSDAQVLDTEAEGVEDGQLTVTGTGVDILSNELVVDVADQGVLGESAARSIGLACIFTHEANHNSARTAAGFTANTSMVNADNRNDGLLLASSSQWNINVNLKTTADTTAGSHFFWLDTSSYALNTPYTFALIVGGYNVNGVPYNTGDTKADFVYGGNIFRNVAGTWILGYRVSGGNDTPLYPIMQAGFTARSHTIDSFVVPDVDLSALLVPNNLDTSVATTDAFTHIADCVIESLVTTLPSSGNYDIEFRRQDDTHKWICRTTSAGAISLIEDDAGEVTRIGPVAAAVSNGDRIVIVAEDDDIIIHSADVRRGAYASAANFKTDTGGKVVFGSGTIAHIADWSRGTDSAYSDLGTY